MKPHGKSSGRGRLTGIAPTVTALVTAATVGFLARCVANGQGAELTPAPAVDAIPGEGDTAVMEALKPILREYDLPALAAAIVTSAGVQKVGVVGVRKKGADVPASLADVWHLGSDTKAMTATVIARLVERGELDWTTPLRQVFPDLAEDFHPDMQQVTVEQLLAHRSGLPANLSLRRYQGGDVRSLRRQAVREYLANAPPHPPGSQTEYSNLGYIVVGAVIERTLDTAWEDAIRTELFDPLSMESAAFGGTGTPGEIDQPWPHHTQGKPAPTNGPDMDNPPVMGPAGRVHCSIADWARFVQDQLRGARGDTNALLQPALYTRMHTPRAGAGYALGWGVTERAWGGGTVLYHGGDNTLNHATVWIAPRRDLALLACTNQGGDKAAQATDAAVGALIQRLERRTTDPP